MFCQDYVVGDFCFLLGYLFILIFLGGGLLFVWDVFGGAGVVWGGGVILFCY